MVFLRRVFFTFLLLAILWAGGFVWFVSLIPLSPTVNNTKTDAIVVLTGGSLRLEHGLSLLITGEAPALFISGVEEGITLPSLLHGKEVTQLSSLVPQDRISLGYNARSTFQNAEETMYWSRQHKIKSFRLVTGNYHMPRSLFEMQQAMPGVTIIPDPVFPAEFSTNSWWLSEYSFRLVVSEYHKYLASHAVHMLGIIADE